MKLLFAFSLIFFISCGDREREKEREVVYNDPRFEKLPCECQCQKDTCGKCPQNCEIKITNNNTCNQETAKEENNTPPIIIIQEQKQDQNQTSENQNNNDNSRSIRAIIEGRYYKCWKPCYGCIPPTDINQNNLKREIYDENRNPLDCYRN